MKTLILNQNNVNMAAEIIKNGGIVAIPTETVYGLAANAFDPEAVKKIYEAKGRPSDNPLIVHISSMKDIYRVVSEFPSKAKKLTEKFWPGPLTLILPKSKLIPETVSGGMHSVAVRFPSHSVAQKIIEESRVPLVAPSANLSGLPSPTKFKHVLEDLEGKIDAIVDGGDCTYGIESTVISLLDETPRLLRPGAITPLEIESVVGKIIVDESVCHKMKENEKVLSPGIKYKHYAPKTKVVIIQADSKTYTEFLNSKKNENPLALCFDEDIPFLKIPYISYGSVKNELEQAKNLFSALRKSDELNYSLIYAHAPNIENIGIAVYNRLIRSAGFDLVKL